MLITDILQDIMEMHYKIKKSFGGNSEFWVSMMVAFY